MKNYYQLNKEKYKAKAKARYELKKEELKANMRVYAKRTTQRGTRLLS